MANNTIRCPLDCINNYVAHQVEIIATKILRSSLLAWEINFTESNVSSLLSWFHHFECLAIATMTWLTAMEYLCRKWPRICSTCRKHFLSSPHSWLLNGCVPRLTRRVQLVEQELLTFPQHMSSHPVFIRVCVTRSLVLCVCLSFCTFSFGHCVVLFRYTNSDHPFVIFKLFLTKNILANDEQYHIYFTFSTFTYCLSTKLICYEGGVIALYLQFR